MISKNIVAAIVMSEQRMESGIGSNTLLTTDV